MHIESNFLELRRTLVRCGLAALTWICLNSNGADPLKQAGTVALVDGDVRIVNAERGNRLALVGGAVYVGERLETGPGGEVHLTMVDSSVIALRANSQLVVADYRAEGDKSDRSTLELLAGGLRTVTGWIGQFNRTAYSIKVANATIGIRGTDHEVSLVGDGAEGEPGVYSRVFEGGTILRSSKGQVEATPGNAAFFPRHGRDRPRLLQKLPSHLKPGRNDGALEGRRAAIRARFAEHRAERIQKVRELRAQRRAETRGPRASMPPKADAKAAREAADDAKTAREARRAERAAKRVASKQAVEDRRAQAKAHRERASP